MLLRRICRDAACNGGIIDIVLREAAWLLFLWQLITCIDCNSSTAPKQRFLGHTASGHEASLVNVLATVSDEQNHSVYVVLCFSTSSDTQSSLLISHLQKQGYGVILPDCTREFADQFISNTTGHKYNLWGRRLVRYREALTKLDDNALVMLLDVNDVLVMGDSREAAEKFKSFRSPLVASCTEGMWPPPEDCPAYSRIQSRFAAVSSCQFPCAGALMGTTSAFREMLRDASISDTTNDQCWLHEKLSTWPGSQWTLDLEGRLFIDVNRVPQGALVPKAGRYIIDGSAVTPTVIHMPGLHPRPAVLNELYALATVAAHLGA